MSDHDYEEWANLPQYPQWDARSSEVPPLTAQLLKKFKRLILTRRAVEAAQERLARQYDRWAAKRTLERG